MQSIAPTGISDRFSLLPNNEIKQSSAFQHGNICPLMQHRAAMDDSSSSAEENEEEAEDGNFYAEDGIVMKVQRRKSDESMSGDDCHESDYSDASQQTCQYSMKTITSSGSDEKNGESETQHDSVKTSCISSIPLHRSGSRMSMGDAQQQPMPHAFRMHSQVYPPTFCPSSPLSPISRRNSDAFVRFSHQIQSQDGNVFIKYASCMTYDTLNACRVYAWTPFTALQTTPLTTRVKPYLCVRDLVGHLLYMYMEDRRLPFPLYDLDAYTLHFGDEEGNMLSDAPLHRDAILQDLEHQHFILKEIPRHLFKKEISFDDIKRLWSVDEHVVVRCHIFKCYEDKKTKDVRILRDACLSDLFKQLCREDQLDIDSYIMRRGDSSEISPTEHVRDIRCKELFLLHRKDARLSAEYLADEERKRALACEKKKDVVHFVIDVHEMKQQSGDAMLEKRGSLRNIFFKSRDGRLYQPHELDNGSIKSSVSGSHSTLAKSTQAHRHSIGDILSAIKEGTRKKTKKMKKEPVSASFVAPKTTKRRMIFEGDYLHLFPEMSGCQAHYGSSPSITTFDSYMCMVDQVEEMQWVEDHANEMRLRFKDEKLKEIIDLTFDCEKEYGDQIIGTWMKAKEFLNAKRLYPYRRASLALS